MTRIADLIAEMRLRANTPAGFMEADELALAWYRHAAIELADEVDRLTLEGPEERSDGETWEAYATRLERRIKQQRDHIKAINALLDEAGVPNKQKRAKIRHLYEQLGRKEARLDDALEANRHISRERDEARRELTLYIAGVRDVEDRKILCYDGEDNLLHEIGPHFAVPGGRALFSLPLSIARIEIAAAVAIREHS